MFKNVGQKIKKVADFLFMFNTFLFLLLAIFCFIKMIDVDIKGLRVIFALSGCVSLIAGPIASWIAALPLYGLGQLVDNSDKIVQNQKLLLSQKRNCNFQETVDQNPAQNK